MGIALVAGAVAVVIQFQSAVTWAIFVLTLALLIGLSLYSVMAMIQDRPVAIRKARTQVYKHTRSVVRDLKSQTVLKGNTVTLHLSVEPLVGRNDYELQYPAKRLVDEDFAEAFFHELHGHALLLGEAGAGKTGIAIRVTEYLLLKARPNKRSPTIPLWLDLAEWRQGQTFGEWVIEYLTRRASIPVATARYLVKNQDLALVLDGLDEIKFEGQRRDCLNRISEFHRENGLIPILVNCRSEDYTRLKFDLGLRTVRIAPIAPEIVAEFVASKGGSSNGLLTLMQVDDQLSAALSTPFLLNAAVMTFKAVDANRVDTYDTVDEWRSAIVKNYVANTYLVKRPSMKYPPETTEPALAWLAQILQKNDFSACYGVVPARYFYYPSSEAAFEWISVGLLGALSAGIVGCATYLVFGTVVAVTFATLAFMLSLLNKLGGQLESSLMTGFMDTPVGWSVSAAVAKWKKAVLVGAAAVLLVVIVSVIGPQWITPAPGFTYQINWTFVIIAVPIAFLLFVALVGVVEGFTFGDEEELPTQREDLITGLGQLIKSAKLWRMLLLRSGILFVCLAGVYLGCWAYVQYVVPIAESKGVVLSSVLWGIPEAPATFWTYLRTLPLGGLEATWLLPIGLACVCLIICFAVTHLDFLWMYFISERWERLMVQRSPMPRHPEVFLDYCTFLGLVRRVGGRYSFSHKLVEEYFAGLPNKYVAATDN